MELPFVHDVYRSEIEEARQDLRDLIIKKNCAPIMLRLAFHDAATYCKDTKTGGPNGSIRMPEEYEQSVNKGLKTAIDFCEEIKLKHPLLTYADIYQLAGVVAVEIAGGPIIDFLPGRKDSEEWTAEGRLPGGETDIKQLMDKCDRMGLHVEDIATLWGAHILDRAQEDRSDFDSPWTGKPLKFDNSYFKEILKLNTDQLQRNVPWVFNGIKGEKLVEMLKEPPEGLLLLPSDRLILSCELIIYVELHAMNPNQFLKDYVISHKNVSELGFTRLTPILQSYVKYKKMVMKRKKRKVVSRTIVGMVIAASVMTVWYRIKKIG